MAPHVVIIPYPSQGHINPLIRLSEKLAFQGIIITFVNTDFNHSRMMKARNHHGISENPLLNIRFVQISDGLPFDFKRTATSVVAFDTLETTMRASAEDLIEKLLTQSWEPPVSCIIGSSFLPSTFDVAKKFELPFVAFWLQAVSVHVIYRHLSMIIDNGDFPPKKQGLPPMHPQDLSSDIQSGDPSNPVHQILVQQLPALKEATCIISNTVCELEIQASNATKERSLFRSIGPLIPSMYLESKDKQEDFSIESPRSLGLWTESNCLPWLDSKPKCSVLYVSFGSLAQISKVQVQEIARGLMESEQAFLWVIRPDLVISGVETTSSIGYNEILPEGFWRKQKIEDFWFHGLRSFLFYHIHLLEASSLMEGGILQWRGWNSTMESLSLGVPMLVFPLGIEQSRNRMLVVNNWKVGLRFDSCRDNLVVEGAEIARSVRALLKDEEMRKRSNEVRETIVRAVVKGGSSWKNMRYFVDYLVSLPTMKKKLSLENGFKRIVGGG